MSRVQIVVQNLFKSVPVNGQITHFLRTLKKREYIACITEPGLGKRYGVGNCIPRSVPGTRNIFHSLNGEQDICSCIVAEPSQEMDLLPQFIDGDVKTSFGGLISRNSVVRGTGMLVGTSKILRSIRLKVRQLQVFRDYRIGNIHLWK